MTPAKKILIVKANGEREPFLPLKLARSMQLAGASPKETEAVVKKIKSGLRDGMKTREIYDQAFDLLRAVRQPLAARYSLKQALAEMGPSGHPFEDFVGEIFRSQGYTVQLRQKLAGVCVTHEVDVVARKESEHVMIETKFHNQFGYKTDVKIALYVKARFDDITKSKSRGPHLHEPWLVTNTKFTTDAITYAECSGLRLLGWNYPQGRNLQNIIESAGLVPVTALTTILAAQKRHLISEGLMLCRDVAASPTTLMKARIPEAQHEAVLQEAAEVCKI